MLLTIRTRCIIPSYQTKQATTLGLTVQYCFGIQMSQVRALDALASLLAAHSLSEINIAQPLILQHPVKPEQWKSCRGTEPWHPKICDRVV
jgi:hypothetical protein